MYNESVSTLATSTLRELVDDRASLFPLSVAQYHRMIETGILPEGGPFELLDGLVIRKDRSKSGEDPMSVGSEHTFVVSAVAELNPKFRRFGCHLRMQMPVTFLPKHEPEPDAAIVVGRHSDYLEGHPTPPRVLCVLEVSDSSLLRDRTAKLRIYAIAGIPVYVIINLPDRLIEVYTQPSARSGRYGQSVTLTRAQVLDLPAPRDKRLAVPAKKLLPR